MEKEYVMSLRNVWRYSALALACLGWALCIPTEAEESYSFVLKWGKSGSGDGEFNQPRGIAADLTGSIYVADTNSHRIQKFDSMGKFLGKWGSQGAGNGQFSVPQGVAVDVSKNLIYVLDSGNFRVQKFDPSGKFLAKWGSEGTGDGQFGRSPFGGGPCGIAVSWWGEVFVADTWNSRIQVFDGDGKFLRKWGSEGQGDGQFEEPRGIVADSEEIVYVAEWSNHRVQKFDYWGSFRDKWGQSGIGDGYFNSPSAVALYPGSLSSMNKEVFVVDTYNHRVQKFDHWGDFLTKWGSRGDDDGEFYIPGGVAVDSAGNVYVADTQNHRIQKFRPDYRARGIVGPPDSPTIEWNSAVGREYRIWVSSDLLNWTTASRQNGWGVGFNYWTDDGNHPLGPPSGQQRRFYRVQEETASGYWFLILTPAEFQNALLPLLAHKNATGMRTMLETLESIYADPAYSGGRDPQEKIKLAIAEMYQRYLIQAVMLVGDVDKFPVRYTRNWDANIWGHSFCPSDLYYADLYDYQDNDPWDRDTGGFDDWDSNHNNLFAELGPQEGWTDNWEELNPDKVDFKPDVAVGRIPASTTQEVATMVRKIIAYETGASQDWAKRLMLVTGNWGNPDPIADGIANTMAGIGYTSAKHYWTTDWTTYPNIDDRANLLKAEMNSGCGFVAYLGHGAGGTIGSRGGNGGAWAGWYDYLDIPMLSNAGKPPVILAAACGTAAFHFPDWPYLDKSGNEIGCHAEEDDAFKRDATFRKKPNPVVPSLIGFESYNYPNSFISRQDSDLYIVEGGPDVFQIAAPEHDPALYWRSLRSHNFPDRYIRHSFFRGQLTQIASDTDKQDATFRIVPGLADATIAATYQYVSFESWNYPGWYLKEDNAELTLSPRKTCDDEFDRSATFKHVAGLADGSAASFEAYTKPGHFIRHWNFVLLVEPGSGSLFEQDATFRLVASQYDPTPHYCSLQLGFTNTFVLRKELDTDTVATVGPVSSLDDEMAATFRLVPGLADPVKSDLVSFEALLPEKQGGVYRLRSFPEHYLRHESFRIKLHERRPANLRDYPEPAALQPPAYDLDCMAEHFLVKRDVGGIAYIGCTTGAQSDSMNMVQYFFDEVASWYPTGIPLGECWKFAVIRFIGEDFPRIEGLWGGWECGALLQHMHKMMLFGDPSLQMRGL